MVRVGNVLTPDPLDNLGHLIRPGDRVAFAGLSGPAAVIRTGVVVRIRHRGSLVIEQPGGAEVIRKPGAVVVAAAQVKVPVVSQIGVA